MKSSTCFLIASTTRGCECPVAQTATPALKSRKMLPSTSSIIAPFARLMTNGYGRVYEGEMYFVSRSTISLALGPGNSVLIWGTFADFSSAAPFMLLPPLFFLHITRHFSFVIAGYGFDSGFRPDDRQMSDGKILDAFFCLTFFCPALLSDYREWSGGALIREEIFAGESGYVLFNQRYYFLRHLKPSFVSSSVMPIAVS